MAPKRNVKPFNRNPQNPIVAALQPFVDNHSIAGAVTLVATKNKILDESTVGFANLTTHKPMQPDNVFWIASMTKPMTGTALMMLVDEGRVNVDDPVEKYLPEFKGQMVIAKQDERHIVLKHPTHPITVRNVLTHTSGLLPRTALEQPTVDLHPLRTAVLSYAMTPLQFQPDTKYQYCNAGTNTAARIIEVVSGQPYETFMADRLFRPLGMTETTFWPSASQIRRLARVYQPNAAKTGLEETTLSYFKHPLHDRRRYPFPAGGLFSTARDVLQFGRMILNGGTWAGRRYLTAAAVREMTRRQTAPELSDGYGYGWLAGNGWCGHGGALATKFTIHWQQGLVTVLLVQYLGPWEESDKFRQAFEQAALQLQN